MILSTKTKIAIAKTLHRLVRSGRHLVGQSMQGEFVRKGIRWQLDLDEGIDLSIYLMGAFEPATAKACRKVIQPGDVVFDVGANMGAHTLPFAQWAGPTGRVHAFEPTLPMLAKLRRNCALNPGLSDRIVVNHAFCTYLPQANIPAAVYSTWPLTESADGLHPIHLGKKNPVGVPKVVVLDEYAEQAGLTRLNFIKIDVDGSEIAVLKGAQRLLAKFRPKILTEVAPYLFAENGENMETFWSIFRQHGYQMHRVGSDELLPLNSDYFVKHLVGHSSLNVLLV